MLIAYVPYANISGGRDWVNLVLISQRPHDLAPHLGLTIDQNLTNNHSKINRVLCIECVSGVR